MKQATKDLRAKWSEAKKTITQEEQESISKFIADNALKISPLSYFIVSQQMKAQDLDGIPYRDAKTFKGWKSQGLCVKKGQHSFATGITWRTAKTKDENGKWVDSEDTGFVVPMGYKLFHRSQVE